MEKGRNVCATKAAIRGLLSKIKPLKPEMQASCKEIIKGVKLLAASMIRLEPCSTEHSATVPDTDKSLQVVPSKELDLLK